MNPASNNIPSDWYPEKSDAALTNERKHTKQIANMPRGQILKTSSTEAISPADHKAISIGELLLNHSNLGAYQNLKRPAELATASRYSRAGRIPSGPMSPRI